MTKEKETEILQKQSRKEQERNIKKETAKEREMKRARKKYV